jgi:uncharacterized protein (TIGR02271 family)
MAMERSTVVGVFHDRDLAERAIDELHRMGFHDDEIGFAQRGEGSDDSGRTRDGSEAAADTGGGAISGAIAGAGIGGLIAAAAAMLIPGFGPVVAGGILATVLGGAAVGAAAGGILGALMGLGVPEEEARFYEGEFNEGRILVTVKAGSRYNEARQVLLRNGAYDVEDRQGRTGVVDRDPTMGSAGVGTVAHDTDVRRTGSDLSGNVDMNANRGVGRETAMNRDVDSDRDRLQLREEEIRPRTETRQTGEVTVGKDVVTERKEMDVPVRREEVTIERHPVEGRPASGGIREGEEIRVPVHEEQVDVDKQAVVYEEVEVNKRQVQDTERVSAETRREEPRIERHGDVNVRGWNDVMPEYRQQWQTRYGQQGGRWEDYEPAYRYGYEMSSDPRWEGRDWSQAEPDLRRDWANWSQRNGYQGNENAWDRFRDTVRETWDTSRSRRRAA